MPLGLARVLSSMGILVHTYSYFSYNKSDPAVQGGAVNYLLTEAPLERFGAMVESIKELPYADKNNISFLGESRGGEAALLVAPVFR